MRSPLPGEVPPGRVPDMQVRRAEEVPMRQAHEGATVLEAVQLPDQVPTAQELRQARVQAKVLPGRLQMKWPRPQKSTPGGSKIEPRGLAALGTSYVQRPFPLGIRR